MLEVGVANSEVGVANSQGRVMAPLVLHPDGVKYQLAQIRNQNITDDLYLNFADL